MILNKKKVLSVSQVVDRGRNSFRNRVKSIRIIRVFFSEALKILLEGKEIRFPGNENGKIYLVVKHINASGIKRMEKICSKRKESFLKGIVKPNLHGFKVNTVGRVGKDKKFTLRFSYPERSISKIQKHFQDDIKRRQLPEIQ